MQRICVFCGSSSGENPTYAQAARDLGQTLAQRSIGVVYGGTTLGLMGQVAQAALDAGGQAIGVVPDFLTRKEIAHTGLTDLHVVRSLHERKQLMARLSDGFIAIPGGMGTLDELSEMLTWTQLGLHAKPVGVLNV
ncbi:MAG: TIGR00730 family Rossman fold protein, partial [Deltaproteobacteria bacterium]|nr:TIGR00730 family Rossman fold protein [Deltaproteobacteria bacterium]